MAALHGGKAGGDNGVLGIAFADARASEGEEMSKREQTGASWRCWSPPRLDWWGPCQHMYTRWWAWPDDGRPPPARSESAWVVLVRLKPPPSSLSLKLAWFSENHKNQSCRASWVLQLYLNEFGLDQPSLQNIVYQTRVHWNCKSLPDLENFQSKK